MDEKNNKQKPLNERVYDYLDENKDQFDGKGVPVAMVKQHFGESGTNEGSISGILHGMLSEGRVTRPQRGRYLPNGPVKFAKSSDVIAMLMGDLSVVYKKYASLSVQEYRKLNDEQQKKYDDCMDELGNLLKGTNDFGV